MVVARFWRAAESFEGRRPVVGSGFIYFKVADKMRTFDIAIDIGAPADQVWDVMIDVERWHEWTASITSIRKLDGGPLKIGSRARVVQPKLLPAVWQVTRLEPGRHFTWQSGGPGMRVVGRHSVEPRGEGSRAMLSVQFDGLFGGIVARLLRNLNLRYLHLEAAGLKKRAESSWR
jgi:uncharacterized membrane protein